MDEGRIYLDSAATVPLTQHALEVLVSCERDAWGNASQVYSSGRKARAVLDRARQEIAAALRVLPEEICFTSGGSESDNLALKGAMLPFLSQGAHLITTQVEHPAVMNTASWLERMGCRVTRLPVDRHGAVDPEDVKRAVCPDTRLISVMTANNELGTLEPLEAIGQIALELGIPLHTDAVQAAALLGPDVIVPGVSMMSLSAHKFGGPKGAGVLYVRKGTKLQPLIHGGEQERGLRASTENVPACAAMSAAFTDAVASRAGTWERLSCLRATLAAAISAGIPDAVLNGDPVRRLPGHAHFSFPGVQDEALIPLLDLKGVEASAGSACTAGTIRESHVLRAIGLPAELARGSLRLTPLASQTEQDMLRAADIIVRTVRSLRQ